MNAFMRLSDSYLADAERGPQSTRGLKTCYFEAGYIALLGTRSAIERRSVDHPSAQLLKRACEALDVAAGIGSQYVAHQYAPDDDGLPDLDALREWALDVRRAVLAQGAS